MTGRADKGRPRRGLAARGRRLIRAQYADFLPQAQAIAEREAAPMARVLVVTVAALFAAALVWSAFADVEQVASAPGVVRPAGKVKVVNHPDGGRVAAILVSEGDRVQVGQLLLELDPEVVREEIAKRTNEWMSLSAEVSRLEAEANGGPPDFDPEVRSSRPDLVATHGQLYESRRQALEARRAVADRVIEQRARDRAALAARLKQLGSSLKILREQEKAVAELADKGYFPRLRYLSIRRQVSELEGQIAETREAARSAESALAEAKSRRASIDGERRSEVLTRLTGARRERDRTKSSLVQEEARLRNLSVRAPTAGAVQNVNVVSVGQAIRANEPLMNIVPSGAQLVVEARVSNDDIGYVVPGQKATVKIRTYDFVRFGALEGVVEQIAPDAMPDPETGQMLFNVMVRTDRAYLGRNPGEHPVNPGMEAAVDLQIGERSILSYLTDRLSRTAQSAFRER